MKLTDEGLKDIKRRHETEAATDKALGMTSWQCQRDRAALLDHIESRGAGFQFFTAMGGMMGTLTGFGIGYAVLRWLFVDDVVAIGNWLVAHIRVVS